MQKGASRSIFAVILVGTLWLASCRKDGADEMRQAIAAMQKVKTLRMTSGHTKGDLSLWEFVCPDKIRIVNNNGYYEDIEIGKKFFRREGSGPWIEKENSFFPAEGCGAWLLPLVGKDQQLSRNYEFRRLGSDNVSGVTCDSWAGLDQQYPRPKNGGLLEGIDIIVCINPANHLVLQLKQGDEFRQYSDFNQDITIQEPETTPVTPTAAPGQLQ